MNIRLISSACRRFRFSGSGLGCIYISSICAVSCFFVRHRVAATTIALSGSGVGMTVFPPLIAHFTKSMDFNESMYYFAAVSLQVSFSLRTIFHFRLLLLHLGFVFGTFNLASV